MRSAKVRVTTVIAVVTVVAFLLARVTGLEGALAYAAGFIPARVAQPGLFDGAGLPLPVWPVVLTPLGASLLHGGWLHIGFNMLILLYCGRQVEMVVGERLYLLLYVAGAYAAALGQWLLTPDALVPMIGASGAISAVLGAYALLYSNSEVRSIGPIPANIVRMVWLGAGWVFLQFLIGVASSSGPGLTGSGDKVAIGAHIGGFIAGMLLIKPMLGMRFRSRRR